MKRVLVVDDDDTIRQLLSINLLAEGVEVDAVRDGETARESAWDVTPDVIVLDVMMPGIDGLSLLRELRAEPRTEHVPVILLTACTSDEQVWAGWAAGADYYLTKPFDLAELLDVIASLGPGADGPAVGDPAAVGGVA
jgi:DNA-binding response OmpR family regulator